MKPHEFWVLTYAEFRQMVEGYVRKQKRCNDDLMSLAWHTAYFGRVEEMPALDSLLQDDDDNNNPHEQTDDEMLAMAKMLNAAFGGEVVET